MSTNPDTTTAQGAPWAPILFHPKSAIEWTHGRLVRIYNKGELVLYFMTCTRYAAGGCGTKRKFNALNEDDIGGFL